MKKKLTQEELNRIIEDHAHYLAKDCEDWYRLYAHLHDVDASGLDFSNMDLRDACMSYSVFDGANFANCNLYGADMSDSTFKHANLNNSDMTNADIRGSKFTYADMSFSIITNAMYDEVTAFECADMNMVEGVPPLQCPQSGSFIGYKKALTENNATLLITLEIPEDAFRSSNTSTLCRCSKARIIDARTYNNKSVYKSDIHSIYNSSYKYKVGDVLSVDDFDTNRWNNTQGIYFYCSRAEALNYQLQKYY